MLDGQGRFRLHRRAAREAEQDLQQWADNWRLVIPELPTDPTRLARTAAGYDTHQVPAAIHTYARTAAEHAQPEHQTGVRAAQAAAEHARQAETTYRQAADFYDRQLIRYGLAYAHDPEALLARTEQRVTVLTSQHATGREQIKKLLGEPALRSLPAERLQAEREMWRRDREAQRRAEQQAAPSPGHGSRARSI